MIRGVLFDLGGTLHTVSSPEGRDVRFARLLLERLADYGITLDAEPEELAKRLHENSEDYKHHSEADLRELPAVEIWNDWYLRDWAIGRERLAPAAGGVGLPFEYERG